MKKISFLTSSLLAAAAATFFLVTKIQAQSVLVETPKSGVSISYNSDRSIKRIDAVFTNELTLDSLISISKKLEKSDVFLKYRSMEFGIDGQLTGISCEVSDRTQQASGSVSVGYLDSLNSEKTYGFYFDYSPAAKSPFCSGSCW